MAAANLALRLVLELGALVALAYAGWRLGPGTAGALLLAVIAPVAFATVWGLLISPKAPRRLADPLRLVVEVVLFALAAGMLTAAGAGALGAILVIAVAVQLTLMLALSQRGL